MQLLNDLKAKGVFLVLIITEFIWGLIVALGLIESAVYFKMYLPVVITANLLTLLPFVVIIKKLNKIAAGDQDADIELWDTVVFWFFIVTNLLLMEFILRMSGLISIGLF